MPDKPNGDCTKEKPHVMGKDARIHVLHFDNYSWLLGKCVTEINIHGPNVQEYHVRDNQISTMGMRDSWGKVGESDLKD